MRVNQIKLGLVVAQPNNGKDELKRFLESEDADFFLFPEGFLHSRNLNTACKIAKEN
ncbi:MAG: hypothetical protein HY840_14905 [Bacteroidetes bacterium]|nr:hypothetical protein [Bacteroidota bacterium]